MRPIPVAFHIWFLEIHTYGIGLALTFWFGLRYTERRLRNAGYPWQWVTGMFVWVIVAAIVGARALHVLSNLSYYSHHPPQVFAIWQGGLSSFGGLLFAVPVALVSSRRRCPQLPTMRFADLMAPVLMACWGIGRLLGPQLMVAGGGHRTDQWFGMYYAGQAGRRLPVPIFQVDRGLHHLRHPAARRAVAADDRARARRARRWRSDRAPHRSPRRASSSAWAWCSGASSGSSTSTCGSARTATSARCWSNGRASRWRWPARSCWSRGSGHCDGGGAARAAIRHRCREPEPDVAELVPAAVPERPEARCPGPSRRRAELPTVGSAATDGD